MNRSIMCVFILVLLSGCALQAPSVKPDTMSGKQALVEKTTDAIKPVVWALSDTNKLVSLFIVFAVIGAIIGAVTRLKFGWIICGINAVAAVGVVLLAVFAAALTKYLWAVAIIGILGVVVGLAFLALKFFAVAKEAFAYGENLKEKVPKETLEATGKIAKSVQPKFVRDTIKWFRDS